MQGSQVTIQDILSKRKALELLTVINGHSVKITANLFTVHNANKYGRYKRSSIVNSTINILYHKVRIKDVFPKITKKSLKQLILDFTKQNKRRVKKREERIELLNNRRYRRLLPLSDTQYKAFEAISEKHKEVVDMARNISIYGFGNTFLGPLLSELTRKTLYHLDEHPHKKPTQKEIKYI